MDLLILFGAMILIFVFMGRSQKKMAARMNEQREAAMKVGAIVSTSSGYIGTIVEIDGGVVTLASPSGDETQWLATSVRSTIDPPYEDSYTADEDVETEPETGSSSGGPFLGDDNDRRRDDDSPLR